jgi:hypothetical protein
MERMGTTPEKQHAHELIERPLDSQIATAVRFLESMLLDPVARAVATAPPDDEPVSEQERLRFHNGQAWFRKHGGKGVPMEDVLAEFDFKPKTSTFPVMRQILRSSLTRRVSEMGPGVSASLTIWACSCW